MAAYYVLSVIKECIDVNRRWQEGKVTYKDTTQVAAMIADLAQEEKFYGKI
jgi:hypothetical protein